MLDRKAQVKHLVIHDVLDRKLRNLRAVEKTADHNSVMAGIIVPEIRTRRADGPAEVRPGHHAPEEPGVQVFENLQQIPAGAFRRTDFFSAPLAPETLQFDPDVPAVKVKAITMRAPARHRLPPQLRNQDPREGLDNGRRRVAQKIGYTNFQLTVPEPYEAVSISEFAELKTNRRNRCPRPNLSKDTAPNLLVSLKKKSALECRLHDLRL
jgi:hypothetical protein